MIKPHIIFDKNNLSLKIKNFLYKKIKNYSVLKTFKSKYNSLVFFDGSKFPHSMNIVNDRFFRDIPLFSYPQAYWENYRCNQAFFLEVTETPS